MYFGKLILDGVKFLYGEYNNDEMSIDKGAVADFSGNGSRIISIDKENQPPTAQIKAAQLVTEKGTKGKGKSKNEFSKDEDLLLIREVEIRPPLWNYTIDVLLRTKDKKTLLWQQIEKKFIENKFVGKIYFKDYIFCSSISMSH